MIEGNMNKVPKVRLASVYANRDAARLDDFMNLITGLGTASRDKRLSSNVTWASRLTQPQLEEWYAGDSMFARIIDTLPDDMTREGIVVATGDSALDRELGEFLRELDLMDQLAWAMKLARLYGGSAMLIGANDGRRPDEELDVESVLSLDYLTVLDRWSIVPTTDVYDDPMKPKFGKPRTYRIQPVTGYTQSSGVLVHESRLVRFDGVKLPDRLALRNQGWGDPIGNRLYNAIRNYHVVHDSAATIVHDFTQGVYTFKGLAELLAAGPEGIAAVKTRLTELDMSKSIVRALVLDEDEDYKKLSTVVSGLKDLIEAAERRLTAESSMPHTRLLGESPGASLGEGGQAQDRQWYDHVASKQEVSLRTPIEKVVRVALAAKKGPAGGAVPPEWSLAFNPLWQMTEAEAVEVRYKQAQTDKVYVDMGGLTPDEAVMSRFGGSSYSTETTLDMELRDSIGRLPDEAGDESASPGGDGARLGERQEPPEEDEPAQ